MARGIDHTAPSASNPNPHDSEVMHDTGVHGRATTYQGVHFAGASALAVQEEQHAFYGLKQHHDYGGGNNT